MSNQVIVAQYIIPHHATPHLRYVCLSFIERSNVNSLNVSGNLI